MSTTTNELSNRANSNVEDDGEKNSNQQTISKDSSTDFVKVFAIFFIFRSQFLSNFFAKWFSIFRKEKLSNVASSTNKYQPLKLPLNQGN
jgi:hypothetical protein